MKEDLLAEKHTCLRCNKTRKERVLVECWGKYICTRCDEVIIATAWQQRRVVTDREAAFTLSRNQ